MFLFAYSFITFTSFLTVIYLLCSTNALQKSLEVTVVLLKQQCVNLTKQIFSKLYWFFDKQNKRASMLHKGW